MPRNAVKGSGYALALTNISFLILFFAQMISYMGDRLDQFTLLELARRQSVSVSASDVTRPHDLARRLKSGDGATAVAVRDALTTEGRRLLREWDAGRPPDAALNAAVVEGLNRAIEGPGPPATDDASSPSLSRDDGERGHVGSSVLDRIKRNRRRLGRAFPDALRPMSERTLGSDVIMNIMGVCLLAPFVLLAPIVGPVVDRFSRKNILIVTSFCQGAIILSIPFVRETAFVQQNAVAMIFLVIFLIGSFTAFFGPARMSLVAEILPAEGLMAGNSLTAFAGTVMNMVGALVAAWMLRRFGHQLDICFYIDTATYVISAVMFFFIVVPQTPQVLALREQREKHVEPYWVKIAKAIDYARRHRRPLKMVLLSGAFAVMGGLVYSMINAKVLGEMKAATSTYGLVSGVFGIAMVAGGLGMTLFHRRLPSYEGFTALAFVVVGVCMYWLTAAGDMVFAVSDPAAAFFEGMFLRVEDGRVHITSGVFPIVVMGAIGGALMVFIPTIIQRSAPKRYHGRLFALNNFVFFTVIISSMGLGSFLQDCVREGYFSLTAVGWWLTALGLLLALCVLASTQWLWFKWLRMLAAPLLKVYCRLEIEGRENVPERGALIVAANHSSWLDTVFIGVAVPRVVHYLAGAKVYDFWLFRPFMRLFGALPVQQGAGATGAMKSAIDVLERRRVFGIFPEGALSPDGRLQPAKAGIGFVARETGAPILPVALIGAFDVLPVDKRFPRPARVRVRIGEPIDPTGMSKDEIKDATMGAIAELMGAEWPPAA